MDSEELRRLWADRSGEFSPEYYAYRGPDGASEAVRTVVERFVGPEAAVLEVGCSSGRHLAHLHRHGFEDLHGVDINANAFDVMREAFPDLAAAGTFRVGAVEEIVDDFDEGAFDAVYSVETLQHIHPDDEWVFGPLSRLTDDLLVTVENESAADARPPDDAVARSDYEFPVYQRDWNRIFTELGLVEVAVEAGERDTLRAFRRPDD